jgi:hypothetical protein
MPGLTLTFGARVEPAVLATARAEMLRFEGDTVEGICTDTTLDAAFVGGSWYPRRTCAHPHATVFLEGIVYNLPDADVEERLRGIADTLVRGDDPHMSATSFVSNADGDYLALVYAPCAHRLLVFNDRWGRLPTFWHADRQRFALAREAKFLHYTQQSLEFSRTALAEYLLLGYVLGSRTLIHGVRRLEPASILVCSQNVDGIRVQLQESCPPLFREDRSKHGTKHYAAKCAELLLVSTDQRVRTVERGGYRIVADLSGGFDSRAVCGALHAVGATAELHTDAIVTGDESAYASQVADVLNRPLRHFQPTHHMSLEWMQRLAYDLDCQTDVFPAVPCFQDSLEHIRSYGVQRVARFGGFGGGEFIKRTPRSKRGYTSIVEMMRAGHLVGTGRMRAVATLTATPIESLASHLADYFRTYRETRLSDQVRRFHYEYESTIVLGGEDRNRRFYWTVQPLWADAFMSYVLRIPERAIPYRRLAFALLNAIDPQLASIPVWNNKEVHNSRLADLQQYLSSLQLDIVRNLAYRSDAATSLAVRYRQRTTSRIADAETTAAREHVLRGLRTSPLPNVFAGEEIVASHVSRVDKYGAYRLLTPLLYIEQVAARHPGKISSSD